jgi:hypothetical protein
MGVSEALARGDAPPQYTYTRLMHMEWGMSERIHIVVGREEKERFRRLAAREGRTLSEWLREAARARASSATEAGLADASSLRSFFAECDRRERGRGREPDWASHREVIERSKGSGGAAA